MRYNLWRIGLGVLLICLSGCSVGPTYCRPNAQAPCHWKTTQSKASEMAPPVVNWWEVFEDPLLDQLEQRAVACNRDLQAAYERVQRERALAGVERADLFPQVNLEPSYSNSGRLIEVFGIPPAPPGTPPFPDILRIHEMSYSLPLNLSFDLDIWGKQKSEYQSALLSTEAKEAAWCALLLTLTSDLANAYFQLRSLDAQIEILDKTIALRKDSVEINQQRFDLGYVNFTDVSRAETLLYTAEAEYFRVKRKRAVKENMIAVLLGIPASNFTIEANPLEKLPPSIPAGVPSTLLVKRPDIREAERFAASEHALIKSAYADFFPSFNLTADLGFASPDLANFLNWESRLWSYAVNAIAPIFDGKRNCSNLEAAKARFRESSRHYQQKVITAFQEVEDALTNLKYQYHEMEWLDKSVSTAKETKRLSTIRYYRGLTNYLDVAASERAQLEIQITLADLLGWQYVSTVQLIKSLGGSWEREGKHSANPVPR